MSGIVGAPAPFNRTRCFTFNESGYAWGPFTQKPFGRIALPANAMPPGAHVRFTAQFSRAAGVQGWSYRLVAVQGANAVVMLQNSVSTTFSFDIAWDIYLTADRRAMFSRSLNGYNQPGLATAGDLVQRGAVSGALDLNSERGRGQQMFVSYAAASERSAETVLIDWTQPVDIELQITLAGADRISLTGGIIEINGNSAGGSEFCPLRPTYFFGHSLVEGAGATLENDVVSQVAKSWPGKPFFQRGLGGQKIQAIVDRIVADPLARSRDLILWGLENDWATTTANWWAAVEPQLDRLLAFRAPGSRMIVCNSITSADWSQGLRDAVPVGNALLLAKLGSAHIADLYTALCTESNGSVPSAKRVDGIHLTDAGYGDAEDVITAKMTANSWS